MKNITVLFCFAVTVLAAHAFGQQPVAMPEPFGPHSWTATVKVVGEDGNPVIGADVTVSYDLRSPTGQSGKGISWDEIKGVTDANGTFTASHTDTSLSLGIAVENVGYYATHSGHQFYYDKKRQNPSVTLLLKKIGKPIAMYAKQNQQMVFPEYNKAIGYDLEVGDWVGPYGKGINTDLYFTEAHTSAQSGYILSVSFPNVGDGIQEFTMPDIEKGNGLRSAHEAPIDGYQSTTSQTQTTNPNRNFYFRVHTKLDDSGNVVSARYGKIYGDLAQFTYYYNPTPNSRNVEFDPKQNLLGGLDPLEQVKAP